MKEWCKAGCLPDDNELTADLPSCWSARTTCATAGCCQSVAREDASHIPHMRVDRGGLIV
jgi:hypothetical protein